MKHKSTGVATLLSFFWPGLGQIYNGQILKGLFIGFWQLMSGMAVFSMAMVVPSSVLLFIGLGFVFWIAGMYDAHKIADRYNREEKIGQWTGTGKLLGIWGITFIVVMVGSMVLQFKSVNTLAPTGTANSPQITPEISYFPNLKIENLKTGSGYSQFDVPGYSQPKKGIYGSIRNVGDKAVNYIELTVFFLDKSGGRIGEKTHTIISDISFTGDNAPLRPSYVKDFGFSVESDAPSEWSGKIEAEISKITFLK